MRADSPFLHAAIHHADRPALSLWGRDMTYAELDARAEGLAAHLARTVDGVSMGNRIGILAPNVPAFVVALLAAWRSSATVVPLNARLREFELRRIMLDAEVTGLISIGAYRGYSFASVISRLVPDLPHLRACLQVDPYGEVEETVRVPRRTGAQAGPSAAGSTRYPEPTPLDPTIAEILYTSGTTGEPKGALVQHDREASNAHAMSTLLGLTPVDVTVLVVPVSHAFGLSCLLATLASGGRTIMVESTFSIEPVLKTIEKEWATVLHGSPAVFNSVLKARPKGIKPLRTGFVAGAACPPYVIDRLDDVGIRILNLYGMTEIGAAASCRPKDPPTVRHTTCGRPMPGYEFRIAESDEDGLTPGEVLVRGPFVTPGYHHRPAETDDAFVGDGPYPTQGGRPSGIPMWFRTGDLGSIDGGGNLQISGRVKDVVQVAGLSVFPAEIEAFLATHPDITEAVVVGVPHETMGEVLQAYVVRRRGSDLSPPAILRFARANIAGYKLPYAIEMVDKLPRLASGKADRGALTRRAARAAATADDAGKETGVATKRSG